MRWGYSQNIMARIYMIAFEFFYASFAIKETYVNPPCRGLKLMGSSVLGLKL